MAEDPFTDALWSTLHPEKDGCKHENGSGILDTNGNGEFTCHECGFTQKIGRGLQPQPGEKHGL